MMRNRHGIQIACLICLALFLWLGLSFPAAAQSAADRALSELDITQLTDWAEENHVELDVSTLLRALVGGEVDWDEHRIGQSVQSIVLDEIRSVMQLLAALVVPAFLHAVLVGISGKAAGIAAFVCVLTVIGQLIGAYERSMVMASSAISLMTALSSRMYPLLSVLLVASGNPNAGEMFTPAASMAGALSSAVIGQWAIWLCSMTAVVTMAGQLSERMRLEGLAALMKRGFSIGLTALLSVFTAAVSIGGLLARGYDGASIQAVRFATSSLVPIIGGEVADSVSAMASSVALVKNALGVTGIILIGIVCIRPIAVLASVAFCTRLAAALIEPTGAGAMQKMIERMSGVFSMLMVSVMASCIVFFIMVGAAVGVFGG